MNRGEMEMTAAKGLTGFSENDRNVRKDGK